MSKDSSWPVLGCLARSWLSRGSSWPVVGCLWAVPGQFLVVEGQFLASSWLSTDSSWPFRGCLRAVLSLCFFLTVGPFKSMAMGIARGSKIDPKMDS